MPTPHPIVTNLVAPETIREHAVTALTNAGYAAEAKKIAAMAMPALVPHDAAKQLVALQTLAAVSAAIATKAPEVGAKPAAELWRVAALGTLGAVAVTLTGVYRLEPPGGPPDPGLPA